jgi:hypothetical protein
VKHDGATVCTGRVRRLLRAILGTGPVVVVFVAWGFATLPFPLTAAAASSATRDVGVFSPQVVQMYLIWSRIQPHWSQLVTSSGIKSSCGMPASLSVCAQNGTEKGGAVLDARWLTGLGLNHGRFILRIFCRFRGSRTRIVIIVFPALVFLE